MVQTRIMVAALAALIAALTSAAVAEEYTGEITGENVYVRSGPRLNHYPVMKLSHPTEVRVVGRVAGDDGDWLKIVPPAGAFSLISKQFVTAEDSVGTVTGDRVRVRAGSLEQPAMMSHVQGYLSTGATVEIIGDTEEYYKIVPPEGAVLYVSGQFVTPAVAPQPTAPEPSPTVPEVPPTEDPAAAPPQPPAEPAEEAPDAAAFKAAETALMEEYKKPADQRDLQNLLAKYRQIDTPADSPVAARVAYRIRFIERAIQRRQGLEKIEALAAEAARQREALLAARAELTAPPTGVKREDITVMGRLAVSHLYTGEAGHPRRWMLLDESGRIMQMYVETATASRELALAVGWHVRLTGRREYNPRIRTYVLHASRVERVPGGEPVQAPPPRQPAPAPEVEAEPRPWVRPDFGPVDPPAPEVPDEHMAPTAPASPAAPALPIVPGTQPAPPVVDPQEYR